MPDQPDEMSEEKECKRIKSEFIEGVIPDDTAQAAFEYLRDSIKWEQGVKSKNGNTRLAKAVQIGEDDLLDILIENALTKLGKTDIDIYGVYLNYYLNGTMYTPNHSHAKTLQIIISLGATRTLTIGKKEYQMKNGDVAIFGSSIHGVPKDETKEGRISIAIFARA